MGVIPYKGCFYFRGEVFIERQLNTTKPCFPKKIKKVQFYHKIVVINLFFI